MGCGASVEKVDEDHHHLAHKNKVSGIVKTKYGTVNLKALGDSAGNLAIRPVFEGPKCGVYLVSMPSDVDVESTRMSESRTDMDHTDGDQEQEGEGGQQVTPQKATEHGATERVRWALYNDSKMSATITITFFRANGIVSLADDAKEERLDGDRLKLEIKLGSTETKLVAEGSITGYMWKCVYIDAEGKLVPAQALEFK